MRRRRKKTEIREQNESAKCQTKTKRSEAKHNAKGERERERERTGGAKENEKTSKDAYNTLISEDSASVACSFFIVSRTLTHTHRDLARSGYSFQIQLTYNTHTNQPTSISFIEKVETVSAVRCSLFTFNLEL